MGRKRPTPEQIITALREAEVGLARGKEPPGAYTYTACAARACTPGESLPGGPAGRLIRRARSAGGRVRQALKSGGAKGLARDSAPSIP